MEFSTHNQKEINISGTSLVGSIQCSFAQLKKVFGEPSKGDGYKTDAEWEIEFKDGTIATIYNYKDGKNYCGSKGIAKTKLTDWHIGSFDIRAVSYIKKELGF
jgi:hypothetical protein